MFALTGQSRRRSLGPRLLSLVAGVMGVLLAVGAQAQEFRLLMIEQHGCYYCRVFNRDIAPAYEKSELGAAAPLERAQLRGPLPDGVSLASPPVVTPTFILIGADGQEIERLTGFPGEDFFWPYVTDMLSKAQSENGQTGGG